MRTKNKRPKENSYIGLALALSAIITAIIFGVFLVNSGHITDAFGVNTVVTGSLTVNTYCTFSANTGAINFGAFNPPGNTVGTINAIAVTNGGNVNANILVSGSNWNYLANSFNVANTIWNSIQTGTFGFIRMSGTQTDSLIVVNTVAANSIWFGAGVPAGTAPGTYSQTINIINTC
jgi:hypothetical protein